MIGIDGTWRRPFTLEYVSDTGAELTVEDSLEGLHLSEFFLLLSSTGLTYVFALSNDDTNRHGRRSNDHVYVPAAAPRAHEAAAPELAPRGRWPPFDALWRCKTCRYVRPSYDSLACFDFGGLVL